MLIKINSLLAIVILLLPLCITCLNAFAITCDMLPINLDDARTNLRRATNEADFEAAKDYARRAKRALDDAAMSAMDCRCEMAYMEFDTAASRARRAGYASSVEEFVDSLNRAIRAFNSGIDALRICASERR